MSTRGTVIVALLALELGLVVEAGVAIRGGGSVLSPFFFSASSSASSSHVRALTHREFAAQPALTVDIGYADLTVVARPVAHIDVDIQDSHDYGTFRSRAPITAREDGETIRITKPKDHRWSSGDDRMVTVTVPPGTRITVITAGDIKATGLRAEASFHSVGSGTITIDDYDAPILHATSSDGRIELHGITAARLDAKSTGSGIAATGLNIRDGDIESDDEMTLGFAAGSNAVVSAVANDGTVEVTGFSTLSTSDASSRTVRIGSAAGRLDVHASDGNIQLVQEN